MVMLTSDRARHLMSLSKKKRKLYNKRGYKRKGLQFGGLVGKNRFVPISPGPFGGRNYGYGIYRDNLGVIQHGGKKKKNKRARRINKFTKIIKPKKDSLYSESVIVNGLKYSRPT